MALTELRITLLGDPEVVMEGATETLAGTAPDAMQAPEIRRLPSTEQDRAAGASVLEVTVDGWVLRYRVEDERRAALRERARHGRKESSEHVREHLRARIPGRVTRVWVVPGQAVAQGERLLAIEAMKMENEIRAPRAGVVVSLAVEPGMAVELSAELLTLD